MLARLVEAIVRGDALPWTLIAWLWLTATATLLLQGRARPSTPRVLVLLSLCALTSLVGLVAAKALAIPRVRWRATPAPNLVSASGPTWRRLHGPAVQIGGLEAERPERPERPGRAPDIALPTVDAAGRWILVGLLSGRPIEGLAPAPPSPPASEARRGTVTPAPEAGAARLCHPEQTACRPWPAGWPAPDRPPPHADLGWADNFTDGVLAYDVETGRFLYPPEHTPALELAGDLSATTMKPSVPLTQLLLLRRVADDRLSAARVLARSAGPSGSHTYVLERADVSLTAGPIAYRAMLAFLFAGVLCPLLLALAILLAPRWLAASLRRRGAVLRRLPAPLVLEPLPSDGPAGARARMRLAVVRDDADLGDALLPRGAQVQVAVGADDASPIASRTWYELPPPTPGDPPVADLPSTDGAVAHQERGTRRKVGLLVPADPVPFAITARSWLSRIAQPIAIVLTGAAAASPAIVALATLLARR